MHIGFSETVGKFEEQSPEFTENQIKIHTKHGNQQTASHADQLNILWRMQCNAKRQNYEVMHHCHTFRLCAVACVSEFVRKYMPSE